MKKRSDDDICRAVLRLLFYIATEHAYEPARLCCPGYDALVKQGKIR